MSKNCVICRQPLMCGNGELHNACARVLRKWLADGDLVIPDELKARTAEENNDAWRFK